MKMCGDRKEDLWLYLCGESDPAERLRWERHLESCRSCRIEHGRAEKMMKIFRQSSSAPPPDGVQKVIRRLRGLPPFGKKPFFSLPLRPFPSILLAASLLMMIAASVSLYTAGFFFADPGAASPQMAALPDEEEAEVIRHLDLLQEMETIQKLVQRVDRSDVDSTSTDTPTDGQRSERDHETFV